MKADDLLAKVYICFLENKNVVHLGVHEGRQTISSVLYKDFG